MRRALGLTVLMLWTAAPSGAQAPTAGLLTGPFSGSVPSGPASSAALPVSLADALERALAHNLGVIALEEQVASARGTRLRRLRELLPRIEARTDDSVQTRNLAAFGFNASAFPGFPIPAVVGPFNIFDVRVYASQAVIDRHAVHDLRSQAFNVTAAEADVANARDVVTLVVTSLYFQAVASESRIETSRSHVATAEALLALAISQRNAGVTAGIDVVRAQVQVQTQKQRLIAAETELKKQTLQLARVIGLPVAQSIELTDRTSALPEASLRLDEAVTHAVAARADYRAAVERVRVEEASLEAVRAQALPTVDVSVDYGAIGSSPADARRTYALAGSVRWPLFDTGRKGREVETAARLRQRRADAADAAQRIEADVRAAFLDVEASEQQLALARERVALARQELSLAQTRFSAGVSSNLEVIQAQNEISVATDAEIAGLYARNLARASLARAIGSPASEPNATAGGPIRRP